MMIAFFSPSEIEQGVWEVNSSSVIKTLSPQKENMGSRSTLPYVSR
jgi:hypothetical protein